MRTILTVILASLALISACQGPAEDMAVDMAAERAAIREAWDGASAAFLQGEWEPYRRYFVDAPRFRLIHPGIPEWLAGPEEFGEVYPGRIAGAAGWEVSTELFEVNVSPDGNVGWSTARVTINSTGQPQTSWQLAVWEKIEGRWQVSAALAADVVLDGSE